MNTVVALVDLRKNRESPVREAIDLIGGIDDLNNDQREAVIKVGVFGVNTPHYSTVGIVRDIVNAFNASPKIYLAESDNYHGLALDRLQIWNELFTDRVVPFDLSQDTNSFTLRIENPIREIFLELSRVVLKPRAFISTHVLRSYYKGSILKNLFGLPPSPKKAQYHKNEIFYNLLTQLYQVIGGIDLSVLDGSRFCYHMDSLPTDIIAVGRDAVAVETVGAILAGLKISKHKTIESFAEKGYGISDIDKIDIVGESLNEMKERCNKVYLQLKKRFSERPRPWSPTSALSTLIERGYFNSPNRRTLAEVVESMIEDDPRADGRSKIVYTNLQRRVKNGILVSEKSDNGVVFWKA
ncbi:MAG: DUF362 domain-containing protein [Candidatus Thorarchaeota archaeon]